MLTTSSAQRTVRRPGPWAPRRRRTGAAGLSPVEVCGAVARTAVVVMVVVVDAVVRPAGGILSDRLGCDESCGWDDSDDDMILIEERGV